MGGRLLGELEGVTGHVGEGDDLVALVVMAQDEHAAAERGLGDAGPFDQARVGRGRQVTGAVDTLLAPGIGLVPEEEQRERRRLGLVEGVTHGESVSRAPTRAN